VIAPTQMGGEDQGQVTNGYSVAWATFEAFPRHEQTFKLRLYDEKSQFMAEFDIDNPIKTTPTRENWAPEPLPIRKRSSDVAFLLKSAGLKTNATASDKQWRYRNQVEITPAYEVLEAGKASTNWQVVDAELWDSSGNFASEMFGQSR